MSRNLEKEIFSNTFYQVLGKVITSLLGFLSTVLLTRYLGLLKFSQYSMIFVWSGLGFMLTDFGVVTLLIREVATKKADDNFFGGVFTLRLIFNIFLILLLFFLFFYTKQSLKFEILLALLGNLFLSLSSVLWGVYQAKLKFFRVVASQIFTSFISFLLIFLGTKFGATLLFLVFLGTVGNFFCFLISFKLCPSYKKYINLDLKTIKKILKEAWPLGVGGLVTTLYSKIDSFMLSFYYPPIKFPDLGIYLAAYKYFEVASVFTGYFQSTVYSIISSELKRVDSKKIIGKIIFYGFLISLFSVFLIFFSAKYLVSIMGKDFLKAVLPLRILSLALGVGIISGIFLSVAVAGKKQKQVFYYSLCALFLNLVLNALFIPRYSYIGASLTTLITYFFVGITNFLVASRLLKLKR